ncbi:hypothetical protein [Sinomicrobium weinanense]|uniref:Uncharacterized protein n=1 Tax=Sinomicrobium weinanense TaxID=2842200 RepID=A0A926JUR8_9FLAO|nr:hypothetical protein [Sinomicrobium weinanense]MBC9797734.1 hypothetical protein [Sinomicrobium weinanense]MBU3123625.1 hypothetical protein [Sinomicrobium weinanense]
MIKKEIAIGFAVGVIANIFGSLLYILLFFGLGIVETLKEAHKAGHFGSILALGALLNLFAFFGFLKIKRDHRAKGVLLATICTAIIILIYKVFLV